MLFFTASRRRICHWFEQGYFMRGLPAFHRPIILLLGCRQSVFISQCPVEQRISNMNSTDILNRLNPSYARAKKPSVDTYVDPDPRKQAEDARQLAKYVFPRQYGLLSPFALITSKREAFLFPDFLDREDEIKVSQPPAIIIVIRFIALAGQRTLQDSETVEGDTWDAGEDDMEAWQVWI